MKFYFFTEMPYPDLPEDYFERYGSIRVTLPRGLIDPEIMRRRYEDYLEMHEFADEMGLNCMLNEHHQTATCVDASIGAMAGTLIQRTKDARILLLGYPIPHRENPVLVASEAAVLDILSGGRLDCGFVRGVGLEIHPANTNPVHNRERFYESFEVIKRAWAAEEHFSWEGKHFHYRFVNPFPRTYQQPHPPLWTTGGRDRQQIAWAARHGMTFATLLAGFEGAARVYDMYREVCVEQSLPETTPDNFANLFLVYVGENDEDAERGGREVQWYLQTRDGPWFRAPPGWADVETRKQLHQPKAGDQKGYRSMTYEALLESGLIIAGTPDKVVKRLEHFYEMSGCGNILMMMHAGPMSKERVLGSIRRFAEDVMPRVQHLGETPAAQAVAEAGE